MEHAKRLAAQSGFEQLWEYNCIPPKNVLWRKRDYQDTLRVALAAALLLALLAATATERVAATSHCASQSTDPTSPLIRIARSCWA